MQTPPADTPDPIEQTGVIEIPPLTGVYAEPFSCGKLWRLATVFGPAAILASMAIGAGETIVVVRTGSWAGYSLLWLVLLSCIVKALFLTYLLGRYTAVSGEYIGHRLVRLPGPRGWFLIAIIALEMFIAPLVWAAIAKPCGVLIYFLFKDVLPGSISASAWENSLTTFFVALACVFGLMLSFERLEKQQIVICGILVGGTVIGTLMVRPDLWQAFLGSVGLLAVQGELPDWTPPDARQHRLLTMATTFGYVGGTLMGYIVYANWVGLHGWGLTGHKNIEAIRRRAASSSRIDYLPDDPQQVRRARRLLEPLRWDIGMGTIVLFIVTGAFMMSGAAVLYPMLAKGGMEGGFQGWSLLTSQTQVWRNIHPGLVWVYYVTVIAALWGTLQALPEAYARVTQEFCQAIWPRRVWDYITIRVIICSYLFVFTTALVWADVSFNILTQIASFLVSNFALALVMLAAIYLNFKLPPAYRTRLPMLLGSVVATVVLCVVASVSAWGLAMKLLGD